MLIGEYIHAIDDKNRLSFPVKFRKEMRKTVVVAPGLEKSLFVFTLQGWKKIIDKLGEGSLQKDTRAFSRHLIGRAVEASIDANGRILIPETLKQSIGIKDKVAIVGVHSRVELWEEVAWQQYKQGIETHADELADNLGAIGVL